MRLLRPGDLRIGKKGAGVPHLSRERSGGAPASFFCLGINLDGQDFVKRRRCSLSIRAFWLKDFFVL